MLMTKNEKNIKTSCSLDTQPPELRDRDEKQTGAGTIQEERVSDLLHNLDTPKRGVTWNPPKGTTEGAGRITCQTTFHDLAAVLAKPGSPSWLRASRYDAHLQEGPEKEFRKLQARLQSESCWVSSCGMYVTTRWSGPVSKGKSCFTNLIFFYDLLSRCGKRLWLADTQKQSLPFALIAGENRI